MTYLLIIGTPALQPAYGMRPLSKEGLSVVVKGPCTKPDEHIRITVRFSMANLRGTGEAQPD